MAGVGVSDGDNGGVSVEEGVGVMAEVKVRESILYFIRMYYY